MYEAPRIPMRGLREDGRITALRLQEGTSALKVTEVEAKSFLQQMIAAGQAFTTSFKADVGSGANLDLMIVTPELERVHLAYKVDLEGEASVTLYEAATATAGDALAAYNLDRNSAVDPMVVVTSTPTAVTAGTTTIRQNHLKTGSVAVGEMILKAETIYLLRCANASGAANQIAATLEWLEV